jgi:hypothetical protein
VVALFTVFAFVAYRVSDRDLDAELGRRLEAIAASAAVQIRDPRFLSDLAEGDDEQPLFQQAVERLAVIGTATDARVFLLDRQYGSRGDSARKVAIGTLNHRAKLDRTGSHACSTTVSLAASVTFQGNDGIWYKTGYAPVRAPDRTVVFALGAEAPASYFRSPRMGAAGCSPGPGPAAVSVFAAALATLAHAQMRRPRSQPNAWRRRSSRSGRGQDARRLGLLAIRWSACANLPNAMRRCSRCSPASQ